MAASGGNTLDEEEVLIGLFRGKAGELAWQSMKQDVCKHKAQDRERPNYEYYPPRSDISVGSSIQSPTPIPQSSNPDLLRTLHNASSQSPNFSSCALKLRRKKYKCVAIFLIKTYSFFPEIQAKEKKSCGRTNSIAPSSSIRKCAVRWVKGCTDRW